MRHTVRTHVLIRLHPCLQQPPSCQDRTLLSAHLPSAPTWVTRLLSLQKQNITAREAPFCSRSTSQQFVWGQRLPPSWCSTPTMPSGAFGILTGASYFFHNESPVLHWVPCATHGCLCHTHTLRLQSFTFCSKHVKGEFTLHISLFIRQEQPWTSDRTGPCLRRNKEVRGRINSQRCRVACFCTRQKNALKAVTNV